MSYAKTYTFVELVKDAIAADTPFQLVDLSDTTNFPHAHDDRIILKGLQLEATLSSTGGGVFAVYVGVITENDSTDGSATWLRKWDVQPVGGATHYHEQEFPLAGVDLKVISGSLLHFASNASQDDNANWKNDAAIENIVSTTAGNPGVGDLVAWVEEVVNGSTLRARFGVSYDTEEAR